MPTMHASDWHRGPNATGADDIDVIHCTAGSDAKAILQIQSSYQVLQSKKYGYQSTNCYYSSDRQSRASLLTDDIK